MVHLLLVAVYVSRKEVMSGVAWHSPQVNPGAPDCNHITSSSLSIDQSRIWFCETKPFTSLAKRIIGVLRCYNPKRISNESHVQSSELVASASSLSSLSSPSASIIASASATLLAALWSLVYFLDRVRVPLSSLSPSSTTFARS